MASTIDLACAMLVAFLLATAGTAFAISSWMSGRRTFERIERERALPLLGRAPLEAVYAAALPLGRALAAMGVGANAVTLVSLGIAACASIFFAAGWFGVGAAVAIVAALADALDGIIARETRSASRFGQILDTTVDRYVDALLLGGIAFFLRAQPVLLVVSLAALIGGFMVSYASSVLRELGAVDRDAPMRRSHRMIYLLGGALLVPFVKAALPGMSLYVHLSPLIAALVAIAVVANVSAVRRLLMAARTLPAATAPLPRVNGESMTARAARVALPSPATATAATVARAGVGLKRAAAPKSLSHR